jgi:hypothetical protein
MDRKTRNFGTRITAAHPNFYNDSELLEFLLSSSQIKKREALLFFPKVSFYVSIFPLCDCSRAKQEK